MGWSVPRTRKRPTSVVQAQKSGTRDRKGRPHPWENYTIGRILLAEPRFWAEEYWILQPEDWALSTQRGKGYDLHARIRRRSWTQVFDRLRGTIVAEPRSDGRIELPGDYGDPTSPSCSMPVRDHHTGQTVRGKRPHPHGLRRRGNYYDLRRKARPLGVPQRESGPGVE